PLRPGASPGAVLGWRGRDGGRAALPLGGLLMAGGAGAAGGAGGRAALGRLPAFHARRLLGVALVAVAGRPQAAILLRRDLLGRDGPAAVAVLAGRPAPVRAGARGGLMPGPTGATVYSLRFVLVLFHHLLPMASDV